MESNDTTGGGRVPFGDITNNLGNFLVISCIILGACQRGLVSRFNNLLQVPSHRDVLIIER